MNKTQEALKMAIKEMKVYSHITLCEHQCEDKDLLKAINACEEALEQPKFDYNTAFSHGYEAHKVEQQEQEPVAWMMVHREPETGAAYLTFDKPTREQKISHHPHELYTHPAKQLSDDAKLEIIRKWSKEKTMRAQDLIGLCDAIEAKIRGE